MELIPILVKITKGKRADGSVGHLYPPFDELDAELRRGMPWPNLVDLYGGWHYDKRSGLGEADEQNPDPMVWLGAVLVPADFAAAAVERWPKLVELMAEEAFECFYDERAHAHEPAEMISAEILNGIRAKYGLASGLIDATAIAAMEPADRQALDPEHPAPGRVRNTRKTWQRFKLRRGISIARPAEAPPRGGGDR